MARGRDQRAGRPAAPASMVVPSIAGEDVRNSSMLDAFGDMSACTGECHDYCRCRTVMGLEIHGVDYDAIARHYALGDPVSDYALSRAIARSGVDLFENSSYEWEADTGYYGEELNGVTFDGYVADIFDTLARELAALTGPQERLRHVLTQDLGLLPEVLASAEFRLEEVDAGKVHLNPDHPTPTKGALERYRSYYATMGLLMPVEGSDEYQLLDGYQRFLANRHSPYYANSTTRRARTPAQPMRFIVARPGEPS